MRNLDEYTQALAEREDIWNVSAYDTEVVAAYGYNLGLDPDEAEDWSAQVDEAYAGTFDSDEDFAESLAEDIGAVNSDAAWPLYCIDWKRAARDLMMDYFEEGGHYFRHI